MTWRHTIGYFEKNHKDYDYKYIENLIRAKGGCLFKPEAHPSKTFSKPVDIEPTRPDVYAFGVYSGDSLMQICESFNFFNSFLGETRYPMRKFFGFDSFEGMPEDTDEEHVYEAQPSWRKGNFDAREYFGVSTVKDSMAKTRELVEPSLQPETEFVLIPGFFENVLDGGCAKQYDMRPASYIDIDVDIYPSTKTVLDFVFANNIAVEGTIIGFDDWGGSPGWEDRLDGQSRACKEVSIKHGVEYEFLIMSGLGFPHVCALFRVCSVDGIQQKGLQ